MAVVWVQPRSSAVRVGNVGSILAFTRHEDSQSACASLPTALATLVEDSRAAWVFACTDGNLFRTHPRASNGRRTAVDPRRRRVHPASAGRRAGRAALVAFAAQAECTRLAARLC